MVCMDSECTMLCSGCTKSGYYGTCGPSDNHYSRTAIIELIKIDDIEIQKMEYENPFLKRQIKPVKRKKLGY